jgi:hypothetical protein
MEKERWPQHAQSSCVIFLSDQNIIDVKKSSQSQQIAPYCGLTNNSGYLSWPVTPDCCHNERLDH